MRTVLNGLYLASAVLAGAFLVLIGVLIMAQIIARLFAVYLPSMDEFAGYCLAATSFLGLAPTLRRGEHIRVGLLVQRLPRFRRPLELACLAAGTALSGYFAWFAVDMLATSWRFNDVSQGLLPIPLWIPQSGMTVGLAVLFIAFVDDLAVALRGGTPSYAAAAATGPSQPTFER